MLEFSPKRKIRDTVHSPAFIIAILIAVIFVGRGAWNVRQKAMESRVNLKEATEELKTLEDRESSLSQSIKSLQTERGIEAVIREKYRVAKEGEEMIILLGDKKKDREEGEAEESWWKRIFK